MSTTEGKLGENVSVNGAKWFRHVQRADCDYQKKDAKFKQQEVYMRNYI